MIRKYIEWVSSPASPAPAFAGISSRGGIQNKRLYSPHEAVAGSVKHGMRLNIPLLPIRQFIHAWGRSDGKR